MLAEALKIMLCDDRQHDTQRAAAFVKRLATFSLSFGSAESMAGKCWIQKSNQIGKAAQDKIHEPRYEPSSVKLPPTKKCNHPRH